MIGENDKYDCLPINVQGIDCEARVPKGLLEDNSWEEMEVEADNIYYMGVPITLWKKAAQYFHESKTFEIV